MTLVRRSLAMLLVLGLTPGTTRAQEAAPAPAKPAAKPSIYNSKLDAREQVKTAAAKAQRDGKRVLVMFGGDWCGWCHRLHGLFQSDGPIRELLRDEYNLVMVDTKAPHAEELLEECKAALSPDEAKKGVGFPFLAVLDGTGRVLTAQRTDPLEEGDHHDPARVKAFLDRWVAPRASAPKVMADALARAASEDKRVFFHFGSPTCGWCHRLEAFLARPDMAPIFARDFVDAKIDVARMDDADAVREKYAPGPERGVPWIAFLDAEGKTLVTSDGPKGNIGYPVTADEIGHFVVMLRKVARKIEPAQIAAIETALRAEGERIESERTLQPIPPAQP